MKSISPLSTLIPLKNESEVTTETKSETKSEIKTDTKSYTYTDTETGVEKNEGAKTDSSSNENTIYYLMPQSLDYENNHMIRLHLLTVARDYPQHTIILDFNEMDFVGASGIGILVETLKQVRLQVKMLKVIHLKTEFIKVFRLYQFDEESKNSTEENSPEKVSDPL
jgi:anti-sigma B factor antagonist